MEGYIPPTSGPTRIPNAITASNHGRALQNVAKSNDGDVIELTCSTYGVIIQSASRLEKRTCTNIGRKMKGALLIILNVEFRTSITLIVNA